MNWAYVAGFFDGEGSITPAERRISIYQKDPKPLEVIASWLRTKGIRCNVYIRKTPRITNFLVQGQECALRFSGHPDVKIFLAGVLPFLLVKKQAAEDLWRFLIIYPSMSPKTCAKLGGDKRFRLGPRRCAMCGNPTPRRKRFYCDACLPRITKAVALRASQIASESAQQRHRDGRTR